MKAGDKIMLKVPFPQKLDAKYTGPHEISRNKEVSRTTVRSRKQNRQHTEQNVGRYTGQHRTQTTVNRTQTAINRAQTEARQTATRTRDSK